MASEDNVVELNFLSSLKACIELFMWKVSTVFSKSVKYSNSIAKSISKQCQKYV